MEKLIYELVKLHAELIGDPKKLLFGVEINSNGVFSYYYEYDELFKNGFLDDVSAMNDICGVLRGFVEKHDNFNVSIETKYNELIKD